MRDKPSGRSCTSAERYEILIFGPSAVNATTPMEYHIQPSLHSKADDLEGDLAIEIVYDDPQVFARLRVDLVDTRIVDACAKSFDAANTDDIELLKTLAEQALRRSVEDLEEEETCNEEKDVRNGNRCAVILHVRLHVFLNSSALDIGAHIRIYISL
ncbi:hypothetical protein CPB84DRAFT_187000 [Gymnopilus junonius]|uniref:Uncharacterized protein n=1 Tax=Gymnopilus junonius TaxID=109634 RepID=A0A9P5TJ28_GYMJU|nr:hypothetical protein CPB84DRAFT_187000 [Gymnopilus junonius]